MKRERWQRKKDRVEENREVEGEAEEEEASEISKLEKEDGCLRKKNKYVVIRERGKFKKWRKEKRRRVGRLKRKEMKERVRIEGR